MKSEVQVDYGDIILILRYGLDILRGSGTGDYRVIVLPTYVRIHGWVV